MSDFIDENLNGQNPDHDQNRSSEGDAHSSPQEESIESEQRSIPEFGTTYSKRKGRYTYLPSVDAESFYQGLLETNIEHYQTYVDQSEHRIIHASMRQIARQKIGELQQQIDRAKQAFRTLRGEISALQEKVESLYNQKETSSLRIQELQGIILGKKGELKNSVTPSSTLSAVLYGLAAIVFISAEIMVTQDVVVNNLGMHQFSGYLFGIAIAVLSIALKPAYDRIFEYPFMLEGKKKRMVFFLSVTAIITLITLGALGLFRNIGAAVTLTTENNNLSEAQVSELMGNPLIGIVFTFSAILFAVAGAICLGIAVPVFKVLLKRARDRRRIRRSRKKIGKLESKIEHKQSEINANLSTLRHKETEIQQLPDTEPLEEEIQDWQKVELAAHLSMMTSQRLALNARVLSEYEKGRKFNLKDSMDIHTDNPPSSIIDTGTYGPAPKASSGRRRPSKYMHQRLRDTIRRNN